MYFVTIIFRNIMRRKTRSLLTVLGVALAIAAVVALLGVSNGFKQAFVGIYENRNVDLIVVRAGITDRFASTLNETIGQQIAALPNVQSTAASLTEFDTFTPVRGWNFDSFAFDLMEYPQGRRLRSGDKQAAIIGIGVAEERKLSVGGTIELIGKPFTIVGIYDSKNPIENAAAVIPLKELQEMTGRENQVMEFQVSVRNAPESDRAAVVRAVRDRIDALTDDKGESLRLKAQTTEDFASTNTLLRLADGMAWMTSTIALVIGGVGILNTMIMSVLERTQEIGVLRALGWRKLRIVRLVLGESMLLTLGGALTGALIAIVLTNLLSRFSIVPGIIHGDFSPRVLATALAMAFGVGLFGGIYPAWRGATLPPTEALRYE